MYGLRYFIDEHAVCFRMEGAECLDFLQRISTNSVNTLRSSEAKETILTTEKGRVLDVVTVQRLADEVRLVTSSHRGVVVREWLEKFIIMDDVRIVSANQFRIVRLFGSISAEGMESNSEHDRMIRCKSIQGWDATMIVPLREENETAHAKNASFIDEALETTELEFDSWRIERGFPRVGFELSERSNPLESGAQSLVDFRKGCYIGQEVIARLDTYEKVQRHLCKLTVDSDCELSLLHDAPLYSERDEAGIITSVCAKQDGSGTIGLALIRKAFAIPSSSLAIGEGSIHGRAVVTDVFPFDHQGVQAP